MSAFSPSDLGRRGLGKFRAAIQRHRHSAGSRLDRAILPNGEIRIGAIYADAKLTTGTSDLGKTICFGFFHSSVHRLSCFVTARILRRTVRRTWHSVILTNVTCPGWAERVLNRSGEAAS